MKRIYLTILIMIGMAATMPAFAQDNPITVAFSDPSRPGTLKLDLIQGSVQVRASSGRDVVVNSRSRSGQNRNRRPASAQTEGLHKLDAASSGLSVEEQNNTMTISAGFNSVDLQIDVPTRTNLRLKVVNGGGMTVEGVEGEIEVENDNGSITLTDVSGSVVAHSLNGKVIATMKRVAAQQPMSFASMNGSVDVTLPPDTKANLKLRADNGDVWTDFDVQLKPGTQTNKVDNRNRGGGYRIEVDRNFVGTINGGGPDIELHTMNGSVYIRKSKP